MASFTTGNDAWDQGLGALSGSLFPDPSKIAQAGYYGAQQRKAGIEADIEQQKWGNLQGLSHYITDTYGSRPQPTAGTASNGPAAPTLGLPPQLTAGTPPRSSPPSAFAPPAPNTTTSNGQVPSNDPSAGVVHPASIMPGGGGQVAAAPAGPNGSPAPINLDLGRIAGMALGANLTPDQQRALISTLAVGYVNNGNIASPVSRQLFGDVLASQGNNAIVQERSNLATTAMQGQTSRDVAGIQARSAADLKGMDQIDVIDNATNLPSKITVAEFVAGRGKYSQVAGPPAGAAPAAAPAQPPPFSPPGLGAPAPPPIGPLTISPGGTPAAGPPGATTGAPGVPAAQAPAAGSRYAPYSADAFKPQMYFNPATRTFKTLTQRDWAALPDHDAWRPAGPDDVKPYQVQGATPGSTALVPQAEAPLGPPGQGPAGQAGQGAPAGQAPGQAPISSIVTPQSYSAAPTSEVQNSWNTPGTFMNQQTGELMNNTSRAQFSQRVPAQEQANWQPVTQDDVSKQFNYTGPKGIEVMTRQQFLQRVPPAQRSAYRETGQTETQVGPVIDRGTGQTGFANQATAAANPNMGPLPTGTDAQTATNQAIVTGTTLNESRAAHPAGTLSDQVGAAVLRGQQVGPVPKPNEKDQIAQAMEAQSILGGIYAAPTGPGSWGTNDAEATLPPAGMAMFNARRAAYQRSDPRMTNDQATRLAVQSMQADGHIQMPDDVNRGKLSGDYKPVSLPTLEGGTKPAIELPFREDGGFKPANTTRSVAPVPGAPAAPAAAQPPPQAQFVPVPNAAPLGQTRMRTPPGTYGQTPDGIRYVVGPDGLPYPAQAAGGATAAPPPAISTPAATAPAPATPAPPAPAPAPPAPAPASAPATPPPPSAGGAGQGALIPTHTPGLSIQITGPSQGMAEASVPKGAPPGARALAPEIRDGAHRNAPYNDNERQVAYGGFWFPEAIVQRVPTGGK